MEPKDFQPDVDSTMEPAMEPAMEPTEDSWDNARIRAKARAQLAGRWRKAVLVPIAATLIVVAVFALIYYAVFFAFRVQPYSYSRGGYTSGLPAQLMMLIPVVLVAPVLSLGTTRYFLLIAKGEKATFGTCFFFFRHSPLKAVGLNLLVGLKMILWILPGACILTFLMVLSGGRQDSSIFLILAAVVTAIPLVIAVYSYAMIPFYLAEDPEIRVTDAVRLGIDAMRNERWKLFCLDFTTIGWMRIVSAVAERVFSDGLGGSIVVLLISFGIAVLGVYQQVAYGIFFLNKK